MRGESDNNMKSYNNKIIRNPLLAALALAGLTSGQVQAQVEQDADKVIDQIIVTASKRALTLQETPIAVAVVTKEAIEQTQVFDIADLQALVPTLKVGTATRTTNQTFNIRGFGSSSALGTEPSVGVFVDGVFRSRSTGALADLHDL
jgi:outer membrane receptor for ferrienterochelin and colicin